MPVSRRLSTLVLVLLFGVAHLVSCSGSDDDDSADASGTAETAGGESHDDETGGSGTGSGSGSGESSDDRAMDDLGPLDFDRIGSRTWTLRFGAGPDGPVPRVDDFPITIVFESQGRVGGTSACNSYGGSYDLDDRDLELGEFLSTLVGCSPVEVMESEASYMTALRDVTRIHLDAGPEGDSLILTGSATELIFFDEDQAG